MTIPERRKRIRVTPPRALRAAVNVGFVWRKSIPVAEEDRGGPVIVVRRAETLRQRALLVPRRASRPFPGRGYRRQRRRRRQQRRQRRRGRRSREDESRTGLLAKYHRRGRKKSRKKRGSEAGASTIDDEDRPSSFFFSLAAAVCPRGSAAGAAGTLCPATHGSLKPLTRREWRRRRWWRRPRPPAVGGRGSDASRWQRLFSSVAPIVENCEDHVYGRRGTRGRRRCSGSIFVFWRLFASGHVATILIPRRRARRARLFSGPPSCVLGHRRQRRRRRSLAPAALVIPSWSLFPPA
jgi:hypothetical protein